MTTIINGSSPSITFSDGSAQTSATRPFQNRIINGAMTIDQRNAGASVTPANDAYTLDRWQVNISDSSKFTIQQNAGSVTPPTGFTNYLGVTSSSAFSLAAGSYFVLDQKIEGFNVADLGWGTANAKTVTLSFWVRSSLTGTFGGVLRNSAENRSYPFTYTISAANTWEQKSVTIAGDTSGTWLTTTGVGIYVGFGLGVGTTYSGTAGAWAGSTFASATGATSVVSTNGATFYITGVQLEVGFTATSFDYRPYGTELALCQRYYYGLSGSGIPIMIGQAYSTSAVIGAFVIPTEMRAIPTLSYNVLNAWTSTGSASSATTWTIDSGSSNKLLRISASGGSGLVAGNASGMYFEGASSYFNLSAEL